MGDGLLTPLEAEQTIVVQGPEQVVHIGVRSLRKRHLDAVLNYEHWCRRAGEGASPTSDHLGLPSLHIDLYGTNRSLKTGFTNERVQRRYRHGLAGCCLANGDQARGPS